MPAMVKFYEYNNASNKVGEWGREDGDTAIRV